MTSLRTCDLSSKKKKKKEEVTHQREKVIDSHWLLCLHSAGRSWLDPLSLLRSVDGNSKDTRQNNWTKQAPTGPGNNIAYCRLSEMSSASQSEYGRARRLLELEVQRSLGTIEPL